MRGTKTLIEMLDSMEKFDSGHDVVTAGAIELAMARAGCEGRRLIDLPAWLQGKILRYAKEIS